MSWQFLCREVFVCVPFWARMAKSISCTTEIMWFCIEAINRQRFNTSVCEKGQFKLLLYIQHTETLWLQWCIAAAVIFSIWPDTTNRLVCGIKTGFRSHMFPPQQHKPKHSCTRTNTHLNCSAHTITSIERRENWVGRGERDWVGGSGRKRWRKRQRESRSEWHMAFSLKKDEQRETKTRIWISKIRKRRGTGEGYWRKCRFPLHRKWCRCTHSIS